MPLDLCQASQSARLVTPITNHLQISPHVHGHAEWQIGFIETGSSAHPRGPPHWDLAPPNPWPRVDAASHGQVNWERKRGGDAGDANWVHAALSEPPTIATLIGLAAVCIRIGPVRSTAFAGPVAWELSDRIASLLVPRFPPPCARLVLCLWYVHYVVPSFVRSRHPTCCR